MCTYSPFTIPVHEVNRLVTEQSSHEDNQNTYMIQVILQPVYGAGPLPQACFKKLPRLINGIPLGAGKLSQSQAQSIRWRYVEGGSASGVHSFVSYPIVWEDAEESRRALKGRLIRQAKEVFGDVTVKATVILSHCVSFDAEFYVNDIADCMETGLQFHD